MSLLKEFDEHVAKIRTEIVKLENDLDGANWYNAEEAFFSLEDKIMGDMRAKWAPSGGYRC